MLEFIIGPTCLALDVIGVRYGEREDSCLDDCLVIPGGSQLNLAYGLSCLGHQVAVIGNYDDDPMGVICKLNLIQAGIDVSHMKLSKGSTYTAFVLTEPSIPRRTIFANTASQSDVDFKAQCAALKNIEGEGYYGMLAVSPRNDKEREGYFNLLSTAKNIGRCTFLEPSEDPGQMDFHLMAPLFPYIDLFFPGDKELKNMAGIDDLDLAAEKILENGCPVIVCKLGKYGCRLYTAGMAVTVSGFDVPVKDLTGAGDGFAAGFLHGHSKNWSLSRAAAFANAYAAANIIEIGPRGGMADEISVMKKFSGLI